MFVYDNAVVVVAAAAGNFRSRTAAAAAAAATVVLLLRGYSEPCECEGRTSPYKMSQMCGQSLEGRYI